MNKMVTINQSHQITFDDLIARKDAANLIDKNTNSERIIKELNNNELSRMFNIDIDV